MAAGTTTELVARAAANDEDAWRSLVDRYTRLVWHVIHGFGLRPSVAAEVHQSTWLRLAENIGRISEPESLGSWLATTTRRECLRVGKREAREAPTIGIDLGADSEPLERHLLNDERDAALWDAFTALPASCQQLLRLLICDPPFSYDEISAVLDMPRGSIGPTRSRCLDRLRADARLAALEESS